MFARGPIAPHPAHVTTTNCVCSSFNVETLRCVLAQNGHGRKSMVRIAGLVCGDDKRHSRKVLAAPATGPTDGRDKGRAVPGVGNRSSCTSFSMQSCAATCARRDCWTSKPRSIRPREQAFTLTGSRFAACRRKTSVARGAGQRESPAPLLLLFAGWCLLARLGVAFLIHCSAPPNVREHN
jgi:hypothetical protein